MGSDRNHVARRLAVWAAAAVPDHRRWLPLLPQEVGTRLPTVTPNSKCKLRLLKLERIKDYLLMEEEFVTNQENLKPREEKNEEDRSKVRGNQRPTT